MSQDLIRCRAKSGLIMLKKVHTKDNVADMLTKPLDHKTHMRHVTAMMGPQDKEVTLMASEETSFAQRLLDVHRSAGHAGFAVVRKLLGQPASNDNPTCPECMVAKMRQRGVTIRSGAFDRSK